MTDTKARAPKAKRKPIEGLARHIAMMQARKAVGLPAGDPTDYGLPSTEYVDGAGLSWPTEMATKYGAAKREPWLLAATLRGPLPSVTGMRFIQYRLLSVLIPAVIQVGMKAMRENGLKVCRERSIALYVPASALRLSIDVLMRIHSEYGADVTFDVVSYEGADSDPNSD